MVKEEIRIKKAIVHILDSTIGMPVLSDEELDFGSEFSDFLKEHISKISSGDDGKSCEFYKQESEVYRMLEQYSDDFFVDISKDMADFLYSIMNSNIDIPPADLIVVRFKYGDGEYLGLLKMNYKSLYTHRTLSLEEGKNVFILMGTASTGESLENCYHSVLFHGGKVAGISAVFSAITKMDGIQIESIFSTQDVPNYASHRPNECPLCKQSHPIDALVNGYGYSKL